MRQQNFGEESKKEEIFRLPIADFQFGISMFGQSAIKLSALPELV